MNGSSTIAVDIWGSGSPAPPPPQSPGRGVTVPGERPPVLLQQQQWGQRGNRGTAVSRPAAWHAGGGSVHTATVRLWFMSGYGVPGYCFECCMCEHRAVCHQPWSGWLPPTSFTAQLEKQFPKLPSVRICVVYLGLAPVRHFREGGGHIMGGSISACTFAVCCVSGFATAEQRHGLDFHSLPPATALPS